MARSPVLNARCWSSRPYVALRIMAFVTGTCKQDKHSTHQGRDKTRLIGYRRGILLNRLHVTQQNPFYLIDKWTQNPFYLIHKWTQNLFYLIHKWTQNHFIWFTREHKICFIWLTSKYKIHFMSLTSEYKIHFISLTSEQKIRFIWLTSEHSKTRLNSHHRQVTLTLLVLFAASELANNIDEVRLGKCLDRHQTCVQSPEKQKKMKEAKMTHSTTQTKG